MSHTTLTADLKRQASSEALGDRPSKMPRPDSDNEATVVDGDDAAQVDGVVGDESDYSDIDEEPTAHTQLVLPESVGSSEAAEWWQTTSQRVVRNVVSIHFAIPCAFDSDSAAVSQATGFVVDAERGYILTNRHVVGAGPFWGYCIFDNHEEVDAYPVYRDPVHDFGILKFDPKAIKHMPIEQLELCPEQAKVGVEIRLVGNDAGEKMSILSGVISRLDRDAPDYGEGYCDFNTCYYQASSAASGGSSGSPVVNIKGNAIALQAGGRCDGASTAYFLPLDRPKRALRCIQEGKPITRGDIQCQFKLKPYDECRRLGLTPECEAEMRRAFPAITNLLVVDLVLPEGPASGKVMEGDVLVKVNDELLTSFVRLDEIFDSSVEQDVKLELQRGGETIITTVTVGDLHKITPDRFVSVAGASFHSLSYQQARLYGVACKGVYVAEASGSFRLDGPAFSTILMSVNHKKTPDMETFVEVMKAIPDKARVIVTYKHLHDVHTVNTAVISVDRHWSSKMRLAVRNDNTGLWDFTDIADALPAVPQERRTAEFIKIPNMSHPGVAELIHSFVSVTCEMPIKLDGFPKNRRSGLGLIIDAEKGMVIVSRSIVPYDLCDITITIATSIVVDAKVVFLHPLQNYAIVQYDPKLVDAPVKSARFSSEELTLGTPANFVGSNQINRFVHTATKVADIYAASIPANGASPRYRAVNVEAISVDSSMVAQCPSGVLAADDGTVRALWQTYMGERLQNAHREAEYFFGLDTSSLVPVIEQIQRGVVPKLRILPVEFRAIPMSQARVMGVSEERIKAVSAANSTQHTLYMVTKRTFERTLDENAGLLEGDILLTLNGQLITRMSELNIMYTHKELDAVIMRESEEVSLKLATVPAHDHETDRAVSFCGAILHRPHAAVRQQISKLYSEIYVSSQSRGSPSMQYGLTPTTFITHVNNKATPDLDVFLAAVNQIPDNTYFRLRAKTFDGVTFVITMKKNEHYFPTVVLDKDSKEACGWRREVIEDDSKKAAVATEDSGDVTMAAAE